MSARISVVVPVYNVAAYLDTCLESIAQQTFADLEVIMVDDGSTDESAQIAERYAARDTRFKLVEQANAGLGAARNTGVRHASGEFIVFADSDDVVPRHAYELLLGALDETGSDFASGNVRRLTSIGTQKAGFLSSAFARTRLRTHITRFPPLLLDRTAWNKLFRRSFWDRHKLSFPVGVYYEDTPVMLPAHYLARSVDVLEETVYLWRMREGSDLSITQRRTESKTLRDRVAAVDHVSRFLGEHGFAVSKAAYDRSVVGSDLRFFLEVLPGADEEYRRLFLDLAREFVDRADPWALDQPLAIDRLKWELVRRRALPELLEVLRFEEEELANTPPVRSGRRWYGDYPYRNDKRLNIPSRTFQLGDEFSAVLRLNDVRWEGETLRIEGYAYITLLGAPAAGSQRLQLVARRRSAWPSRLALATEGVLRPDVTAGSAQQVAGLDWSGFVATLNAAELKRGARWQEATWEIGAVIRSENLVRAGWRPEPAPLNPLPPAHLALEDGTRVRAGLDSTGKLVVQVRRRESVVESCDLVDGVLVLQGKAGIAPGARTKLRARRVPGGATVEYPAYVDRSPGSPRFLVRVPINDLIQELDVGDETARVEELGNGVSWELALARGGRPSPLALAVGLPEPSWMLGGREVSVCRTTEGGLAVTEGASRPVIQSARWSPTGGLVVEGSFRARAGDYDLVLTSRTLETFAVPLRLDADTQQFRAEVTPASLHSPLGPRPLPEGVWSLAVRRSGLVGSVPVAAVFAPELSNVVPTSAGNGANLFRLGVDKDDSAVLVVEFDLDPDERGGYNQRRLKKRFYPAQRALALRDAVVYDCFGGREYSDNPRAIHEELVRRDAPLEHLWVVRSAGVSLPKTAVPLRHGSTEYYEALGRARYIVGNDCWPRWFERRSDQIGLQTWHGGPVKLLGHALAERPRALYAYRRTLAQRPANWQYLVSPGSFATAILERAFPFGAELIETGLPRTDILLRPDRERVAEDLKRRLGIQGKRVVLYAPTYRDHLHYRSGRRAAQSRDLPTYAVEFGRRDGYRLGPLLDSAAVQAALGDDHVVVFHKHWRVLDTLPPDAGALDVSGLADATELLLTADVLVTDYSAALIDFACTGRPIVFFTPDLEDYRDEIRGFSIDFEAEAPGPLLRTTEEVIEALREPDAVAEAYRKRHEHFVATYCPLNDGGASGRVVDRVFSW